MYTPLNLSGIPLQFDAAVREGDLDGLRLCMACSHDDKIQILHNDEKYGYLGLCLAWFPADRHGGTHSSMSKERRDARLSMAELLLAFGCSCNPKFVNIDQIERHVVTALLRFPTEFEQETLKEKHRQIGLCRKFLDQGAQCDFFQDFSHHHSLGFLLLSGEWLELLRDIPEFHILGRNFTPPFVENILNKISNNNFERVVVDVPGGSINVFHNGASTANFFTILALCNGHDVPEGTFHNLQRDLHGTVCSMLLEHGQDPWAVYDRKTVLEHWVEMLTHPGVGFDYRYSLEQLKVLADYHPACFAQSTDHGVLSDIVVGHKLYSQTAVAHSDLLVRDLFLFTYQNWQRECLQHAADEVHSQLLGGGRKM